MIVSLWSACAQQLPGEPYLTLRGEIDADVAVQGDDAEATIVWVTAVDGELCLESTIVPFKPYLLQYEATISGPPPLEGQPCVVAPSDLAEVRAAWGVLTLVDPDPREQPQLEADPSALLAWFAGEEPELGPLLVADGGKIAAVARQFILVVSAGPRPLGDRWCRFGEMIEGLVLYVDRGVDCDGWEPVSEPGVRTEIQGVDLQTP